MKANMRNNQTNERTLIPTFLFSPLSLSHSLTHTLPLPPLSLSAFLASFSRPTSVDRKRIGKEREEQL